MKKFICSVFALILALALVGCNSSKNKDSGTSGDDSAPAVPSVNLNIDKNVKADISILIPGGNANEETMIQALINDFALLYPNVNIEMNYVSVNGYQSAIRNLARTDSLDDIVWSNTPDFYYLVEENLIYDLKPYLDASEKAGVFNLANDFYSEFFEMCALDGKYYCIPRSADSVVTFFNKDIFSSAGVDMAKVMQYQKDGWTWDQFLEICQTIRDYFDRSGKSGSYVIDANLTSWLSVCYPMLRSYGVEVVDANGKIALDKAAAKQCLEMVREMVEKRYIVDSREASGSSYESGTSAMLFQSASVSLYANSLALKGKVDLLPFPLINVKNTPKIGCGVAGYCINNKTKYADICWAFLNYMLSRNGQQSMGDNGLNLASIRKDLAVADDANWKKNYPDINMQAYLFGNEYKISTDFLGRINSNAKTDFEQAIKDMFGAACNKTKDIDKAIQDCLDDMEYALDEY